MNKQIEEILKDMWDSGVGILFSGGGQPAHWRQEPYRGDFFAAFAKVYRIDQTVDGECVKRYFTDRAPYMDDPRYRDKMKELAEVCDAWTEWQYAWKNGQG